MEIPIQDIETITKTNEDTKIVTERIASTNTDGASPARTTDEEEEMVSDLESDLEPDEMLSIYISTKKRLFEKRPELFDIPKKKSKAISASTTSKTLTEAQRKLQERLHKIESDALFEQYEADSIWFDMRNQLAQEAAELRKLQGPSRTVAPRDITSEMKPRAEPNGNGSPKGKADQDTSDDENAISELFGAVASDSHTNDEEPVRQEHLNANTEGIVIRDFGQFKGVSPRRILEETCRARSVLLAYA